ncbi:MAG: hypothetical protein FWF46_07590 [Oscillospiraceae bacterium]|nr:hypothetical protein [Oscillospiraceae bacterium]
MSLVDHNQDVSVPYSIDDTFDALKKALANIKQFKVDRVDDIMKIIYAKAGVSVFSWGEKITIQLQENDKGTAVSVLSTPKTGVMLGGMMDMGKNRKNIDTLLNALSDELKNYQKKN